MTTGELTGPLTGYRIIELGSIGPGPWAAMLLSDMGAEVIRVDRPAAVPTSADQSRSIEFVNLRGRRSIAVDLKSAEGKAVVRRLIEQADAVIEGNRPGVVERLGIGPADCLTSNPRLVYGRITGWGQAGPLAQSPGHDLNYLALTGLLAAIGPKERPMPPLNLVGDYGGGAMFLAFGVVCALLEATKSGRGQVIDAAMVDGASLLGSLFHGMRSMGQFGLDRQSNRHDGSVPYYRTYETADAKHVSIAANEPQFFVGLVRGMGFDPGTFPAQHDRARWDEMTELFARAFASKSRDDWTAQLQHLESCFAPVLTIDEAPHHEHNKARSAFVELDGVVQPAPAPRFDRTPGSISRPAATPGEHTIDILSDFGWDRADIDALIQTGAVAAYCARTPADECG